MRTTEYVGAMLFSELCLRVQTISKKLQHRTQLNLALNAKLFILIDELNMENR